MTEPNMTVQEREALELQASRIRESWITDRDAERLKAHEPPQVPEVATDPRPLRNAEHLAVLQVLKTPSEWDLTRNQRGRLRRLKQMVLNPDLSGLDGPDDADYQEFPQLRDLEREVTRARR